MFRRLRAVFQRHTLDREMRAEMDAHIARATERLIARGMSPEAAQLEAHREFGNVGVLQEEARDARGARWVESLLGDVRFAFRHFRRRPLYAFTIVAVLSLGLGSHAAVFAFVQMVTTRAAPGMPDDESIVEIRGKRRPAESTRWVPRPASGPEWHALSELRETFTSVAAWRTEDVVLRVGDAELPGARAHFVSDNYFSTLGLRLQLGAGLPPSRGVGATDVAAIISNLVWRVTFGGAPDVIGKTIDVNGVRATIVGVAPPKFLGVRATGSWNVVWMSLPSLAPVMRAGAASLADNDATSLFVFGRLAAGVTAIQATAAVRIVASRAVAERARPSTPMVYDTDVVPMTTANVLPQDDDVLVIAALLGGIALLVLLVTCTNVSALIVGAAIARRHEIAVRLSLGASRARVVRQLVTENTLLALGGAALGLLLYRAIAAVIMRFAPDVELTPGWKTIALTIVVALGTGILFGLSPALNATRRGVADVLKDSGSGHTSRSRMQRVFVIAQIALSQPLLVGLAMMLGFIPLAAGTMANNVDQRLLYLRVNLGSVNDTSAARRAAAQRFIDGLRVIPGVVDLVPDATYVRTSRMVVHPDDRGSSTAAAEPFSITVVGARPGYFGLVDMPMVRGRDLIDTDTPWQSVVIASDLARRLWNGSDPIGKRFETSEARGLARELVVVGVYDARYETTRGGKNQIFVMQDDRAVNGVLIRTAGPAAALIDSVRATVRRTSATAPIDWIGTVAWMREGSRREALLVSSGTTAAGLLMLLLASLGLYGVVALAVGQRRREIGIRMALGARAAQVVGMLFAGGVRTSVIGLLLGLPLSVVGLRVFIVPSEPDVNPTLIGAAIAIAVLIVAALATWIPARRAATINPVSALKAE
jgi:putative ABC transport system permease protein